MDKNSIFFLLSVSLVTLMLSFLMAFVYTKAFNMSPRASNWVRILGFVFPLLYVGANALSSFSSFESVRWIYISMSVGAGIAFYLLFGAILLAFLMILFKIFGKSLPVSISWFVFLSALILSAIAFIQSKTFQTVSHDVYIENLPDSWVDTTAVLFSDTHYGLVNQKSAAKNLTQKIIYENPDMVLVAGDLFDGPEIETKELVEEWRKLTSKFPVFYTPGNHEEYGNYVNFIDAAREGGFLVLEDEKTVYDGVQIFGIKYRAKNREAEIPELLESKKVNSSQPLIVINHPPIFQKTLNKAGADLMVSGHTHRGQFWPVRYITKAIYGIYHYGLNSYEDLEVLTTSGVGTAGPPMRLFNTPEIVKITFKKK